MLSLTSGGKRKWLDSGVSSLQLAVILKVVRYSIYY